MTDIPLDPFEEDRLDGHTVEELSDYLDAGRLPADPSIDGSAGCQIALAALERLRSASMVAFEEAERRSSGDDGWIRRVMADIAMDAHAGRDIRVHHDDPRVHLAVTEGAVRELVRSVGDGIPGVLTGRVRLVGDVETPGEAIAVQVTVTVAYGTPIPPLAERVRETVREAIRTHTDLEVTEVSVTVTDVHGLPEESR